MIYAIPTQKNRGPVSANYMDSWHLSLFLPHRLERIVREDGSHSLPIMWPFLHGEWIVATDVASMTWCRHEPEGCPIDAETLGRTLGSVRKTFATLCQSWLAIPGKAWITPETEPTREGANYVFSGHLFDADLVDRFRGLGFRFAVSQAHDELSESTPALFLRWGHSGGGVILPVVIDSQHDCTIHRI